MVGGIFDYWCRHMGNKVRVFKRVKQPACSKYEDFIRYFETYIRNIDICNADE
jgi:hypothetical protein